MESAHYAHNNDFLFFKETFRYGNFKDLESTAVELPYKQSQSFTPKGFFKFLNTSKSASDISMLIILPDEKTGLQKLEKKKF
jgi:hypothetical protein